MIRFAALALVALLSGCDAASTPDVAPAEPPPEAVAEPELLPTPFSADEIRDEWVVGLTLVMRTRTPGGESRQRWRVVAADAEGADIEFLAVDAEGNATGEPTIERRGWTELRDHAKYPADVATREPVSRDIELGTLDGWLYRVQDEDTGSETELFFARRFPGAPIEMRMMKDGAAIMEMTQVERQKPAG